MPHIVKHYLALLQGCKVMMDRRQILLKLMSQSDRVQTSIYFPKDIHEALVRWAQEEDRPISNLVVRIVSKAVEEREKQQNSPH
ncbi:ribbon-helix-helix domain-containing protein [Nostoc sp. CMAA1605]|uniref:ribbon-helix-helix domain-containing protein n=1 Tax=Nostoc sp. CMAA1605 TaxID=2055159 RepID=UPI001F207986|nr:hypothetical protein [Nostoc sp. CMAA1605]